MRLAKTPVLISERELACRRKNRSAHSVFVVYLKIDGKIHSVLEIDRHDYFELVPRQYWLFPGSV
jgi:hypothetical protein